MLARIRSVANVGLTAIPVTVEVDVASRGLPSFSIVGLPSKAIDEAKERVRTAIVNSGGEFPAKRITVNLAPADLPKEGAAYDLPIAVGILSASGQIRIEGTDAEGFYYGELGLDGSLKHTRGVLLLALAAKSSGDSLSLFVPVESATEASVVEGVTVYPLRSLRQLCEYFNQESKLEAVRAYPVENVLVNESAEFDFSEIAGQALAKRALMIAAAGGHNVLMSGPPGSGKTMLARALPGILPVLSAAESLEVTRIYSVAGLIGAGEALLRRRPFRSPHHTISLAGLVGGGPRVTPGEVSLAHLGVLFLDEMAEYGRSILEALRQPLEDGRVTISRAIGRVEYPAEFMLVAAVNPCPCGYLGHPTKECRCSTREIARYKQRISGPIMDRIDLQVSVPPVEISKLADSISREASNKRDLSSKEIQKIVTEARQVQIERLKGTGIYTNATMKNKQVKEFCSLSLEAESLLKMALAKFELSARSYFRLVKVARTVADLEKSEEIKEEHVAEVLQYRDRVF